MLCLKADDESHSGLPGVHEDGTARGRLGPFPSVCVAAAPASAEPLHAPEVLGAGQAALVRDAAAERVQGRHLHGHGGRGAARHVDNQREQGLRGQGGDAAVAAEAVHELPRERAEEVQHGRDARPHAT
jgi:hypothetical protein